MNDDLRSAPFCAITFYANDSAYTVIAKGKAEPQSFWDRLRGKPPVVRTYASFTNMNGQVSWAVDGGLNVYMHELPA